METEAWFLPPIDGYMTLSESLRAGARSHLQRALRAFAEGHEHIAYQRMAKAVRAYRDARRFAHIPI